MALAPLAHVLWTRIMNYDAAEPDWPDRDRFVLSAGHASILLYSMLYLTGYGLTLDDLKAFRQWGSAHAGPPRGAPHRRRRGHHRSARPGLRQRRRHGASPSAALRGPVRPEVVDHHTFVICGDGCLEEGISHEAASLAGHLGLGRLVYVYDDNHITIDGPTELALTDDAGKRFEAYGWHVERVGEIANDLDALEAAVRRAMAVDDRPSLIVLRSHIGYPSPEVHRHRGRPRQPARRRRDRAPPRQSWACPRRDVLGARRRARATTATAGRRGRGRRARPGRQRLRRAGPATAAECDACLDRPRASPGWEDEAADVGPSARRSPPGTPAARASTRSLDVVPGLIGGGADLTGNTGTELKGASVQVSDTTGRPPDPLRRPRARHGRRS